MGKAKTINEGKKIETKYCPHCKDKIMIRMKSGETEVFECEGCKFKVGKD